MRRVSITLSAQCGIFLVFALILPGCPTSIANIPHDNIVMLSENGKLVDPGGNGSFLGYRHWPFLPYPRLDEIDDDHARADEKIRSVVAAVVNAPPVARWDDPEKSVCRVTIFIHGGLNFQVGTIKRAAALAPLMARDETVGYPLFINWPSSLYATYGEHLFSVREGRESPSPLGILTWPLVLLTDTITAVARAPVVWMYGARNALDSVGFDFSEHDAAKDRPGGSTLPEVRRGRDDPPWCFRAMRSTGVLLWAPLRAVTSPLVDAFGRPAWENMKRRTTMLFHTRSEFRGAAPSMTKAPDQQSSPGDPGLDLAVGAAQGDLARFFRYLQGEMDAAHGKAGWEITLIAHSMGTIVANEIICTFPDLPVENVVYMAAACSVRDYQNSVFPLLRRRPSANVWNLVLNETAEVDERVCDYFEFVPRGSLLAWIDSYFESPETWLDRTAGRWTNLMATEHLSWNLEDADRRPIRPRIHFKEFDHLASDDPQNPEKHGEFAEAKFWLRSFWEQEAGD
jgi:pimeloyl-ACP methyl ester carboxylesterase